MDFKQIASDALDKAHMEVQDRIADAFIVVEGLVENFIEEAQNAFNEARKGVVDDKVEDVTVADDDFTFTTPESAAPVESDISIQEKRKYLGDLTYNQSMSIGATEEFSNSMREIWLVANDEYINDEVVNAQYAWRKNQESLTNS